MTVFSALPVLNIFYRCCVGIDYPSPISCPRTRARTYTPGQPDIDPLVRAQIDGGDGQGGNEGNQTCSGCRSSSISSSGGGLWQWRGLSTAQWGGQGWAYSHMYVSWLLLESNHNAFHCVVLTHIANPTKYFCCAVFALSELVHPLQPTADEGGYYVLHGFWREGNCLVSVGAKLLVDAFCLRD